MSDKRAPRRSLDDWMELVTECRQSGLTDAAWYKAQGISPSCFYNAFSCQKNTFNFCIIKIMTLKLLSNHKKETNTVVSLFLFVNNLSPSFF